MANDATDPPKPAVRYSASPTPPAGARRKELLIDSRELPPEIAWFKALYIYSRRTVESLQSSVTQRERQYQSSPTWDGGTRSGSLEEKPKKNQWVEVYRKLQPLLSLHNLTPSAYLRMLFWLLRPGATAIPTPQQLPSPLYLEKVFKAMEDWTLELQSNFSGETQRAQRALQFELKANGAKTLSCAVYRVIITRTLGLSALFCYCMACTTVKATEAQGEEDPSRRQLVELLPQLLPHAAEEYSVCPKVYDAIWGDVIPADFRTAAVQLVQAAIKQCLPS